MRYLYICAAVAALLASTQGLAHGSDERAAPGPFDPGSVESTPFGQQGAPRKVTRTIEVRMTDSMRFTPAAITVRKGETVKFVVHNDGHVLYEMVLGTAGALKAHAELMKKFPDMEHADANIAHVKPGKAGAIVWQFTKAGNFAFACLQPGHFEAGMAGKLVVK